MSSIYAEGFWLMVVCFSAIILILASYLWAHIEQNKKNGCGSSNSTYEQRRHNDEMLRSQQELVNIEKERLNLQTSEYLGSAPKDKK